jgi:SAM-dependent methyltransferase
MTEFFPRIREGAHDGAAVLADLLDYHDKNPGITEATLGALRTADGLTGYQLLAAYAEGARSVVDLGCGNGPLIRELHAERIVGVDLCRGDLALIDGDVEKLAVSGQTFGEHLEPASIDAVLSHHAFYLMDPIEPVVASIARVLRPGGVFAFVTSSPNPREPWTSMMRAFAAITKREHPSFRGWGDRRVWNEAGLHELLDRDFHPFSIREFVLVAEEPREQLVDRLLRFFYSAELQSPAARSETRAAWLELMSDKLELPWAIVSCLRR